MGFDISSENDIFITRGDSAEFEIVLFSDDDEPYVCQDGDVIEFTMKRFLTDRTALINKIIPTNTLVLLLLPDDTKDLNIGEYHYDISLTNGQYKNAFVESRRFFVLPKV